MPFMCIVNVWVSFTDDGHVVDMSIFVLTKATVVTSGTFRTNSRYVETYKLKLRSARCTMYIANEVRMKPSRDRCRQKRPERLLCLLCLFFSNIRAEPELIF